MPKDFSLDKLPVKDVAPKEKSVKDKVSAKDPTSSKRDDRTQRDDAVPSFAAEISTDGETSVHQSIVLPEVSPMMPRIYTKLF